jgi:kynurenine 3-monooxygenase
MSQPTDSLKTEIALIGGGPVGALLACLLARRGFSVDVFERRPDLRSTDGSGGRSINLALSTRGLTTLQFVGLEDEVLKLAIPMRGRMIHALNSGLTFQQYGKNDSEYINSISRSALNQLLLDHAEKLGNVNLHFKQKALSANIASNSIRILDEDSRQTQEWTAKLLMACDGSASAVRNQMHSDGLSDTKEDVLNYGYKELTLPAGAGNSFQIEKNALHIWPRGTFMLIALPNLDGSFTCTLFLPLQGENGFENLKSPDAVLAFFDEYFQDAKSLLPNLAKDFFENPTGHMSTVKCAPWNVDGRILLLGDAAHAIVPFFGQGMNCGFEDVMVFEQCISAQSSNNKHDDIDWRKVFDDFYSRRKINADAIADLAVENFIEMRDKVANTQFMLERAVEKRLQTEFPGEFFSRYRLVTFTNVPYSFAQAAGKVTDEILKELCAQISDPSQVDLKLAGKLIKEKLAPMLKKQPELAGVL